jgi:hypothetical protein
MQPNEKKQRISSNIKISISLLVAGLLFFGLDYWLVKMPSNGTLPSALDTILTLDYADVVIVATPAILLAFSLAVLSRNKIIRSICLLITAPIIYYCLYTYLLAASFAN